MSARETGGRFTPTAIRMRAIRRASSHPTPAAFSQFLGITVSRLSNVENGYAIGRGLQNIIVEKLPWISRSYLLDGDERTISGFTAQRLAPFIEEESDTTRARSPRSSARS